MVGRARRPFNPPATSAPASNSGIRVPKLVTDPVWSLQPWPLDVSVDGQVIQIPALPAAEWLATLMSDSLDVSNLFLALAPDLADALDEALFAERLSLEDYVDLAFQVIDQVAGRPWHIALRLIGSAQASWDVVGSEMVFRHIDAATLSLSAWLDAALLIMIRSMDSKDVTMFLAKLEAPLPGVDPFDEMEMPAQDFAALMAGQ